MGAKLQTSAPVLPDHLAAIVLQLELDLEEPPWPGADDWL